MRDKNNLVSLSEKYRPSESCNCKVCINYCSRPGWWTVDEAKKVIKAGYANRMMLEISLESRFGVISPAFKGNESQIALNIHSSNGCTF